MDRGSYELNSRSLTASDVAKTPLRPGVIRSLKWYAVRDPSRIVSSFCSVEIAAKEDRTGRLGLMGQFLSTVMYRSRPVPR